MSASPRIEQKASNEEQEQEDFGKDRECEYGLLFALRRYVFKQLPPPYDTKDWHCDLENQQEKINLVLRLI